MKKYINCRTAIISLITSVKIKLKKIKCAQKKEAITTQINSLMSLKLSIPTLVLTKLIKFLIKNEEKN